MPHATRLLLTPVPRPTPNALSGPPATVTGFTLKFSQFGADGSVATVATQTAQIEFIGRFFKSVRNDPQERVQSLGVIRGDIWLQGRPPRARFQCDQASLAALSGADQSDPTDPNADRNLPRALDLHFDAESFVPCPSVSPQLMLPDFATQYPYLEVMAELKVGVMLEAPRDDNDILDVPIWRDSPPRARAYEVKVIDEVGEPLDGVTLSFSFDGQSVARTTGDDGKARVQSTSKSVAVVSVVDPDLLSPKLKGRWSKVRDKPNLPSDSGLQNRRPKELDAKFECTTNGPTILCVRPPAAMARLYGVLFDTNKCFVLPTAVPSIKGIVDIYRDNEVDNAAESPAAGDPPKTEVLIVGHTDTSGDNDYNFDLSGERAESLKAYLLDDHEAWMKWFGSDKSDSKRWGVGEEQLMIQSLVPPDDIASKGSILAYQDWHNAGETNPKQPKDWARLEPDGKMGDATRRQLIIDYMNQDGTTLDDRVRVVCYGAGEMYPLTETDGELDESPEADSHEQEDRRDEIFFFSKPIGIQPPVPGVADGVSPKKSVKGKAGEKEYQEWVRRAKFIRTLSADPTLYITDYPFSL